MEIFEFVQNITFLSFVFPLIILIGRKSKIIYFRPFLVYSTMALLLTFVTNLFEQFYSNTYPLYHITAIIEYLTIGFIFYSISKEKKIIFGFIIGAFCLNIYESLILYRLMMNNEIFMMYFNLSITIISFCVIVELSKSFHLIDSRLLALFSAGIFCQTSSSFIIGVYETEIRQNVNIISIFVFYLYYLMAFIQNLLNSFLFWKLKEA